MRARGVVFPAIDFFLPIFVAFASGDPKRIGN
jgi:hypothetical protein